MADFSLATVETVDLREPSRIVIYGPHGIGKTTWALNQWPRPIAIDVEGGLGRADVAPGTLARFPRVETLDDVMAIVTTLYIEDHDYRTVVIDTLDWLEPLVWASTMTKMGQPGASIEDVGYGKGYVFADLEWQRLLDGLDGLRGERDMHIVITAHVQTTTVQSPLTDPYNKHTLKLHKRASERWLEWADVIAYAHQPVTAQGVVRDAKRGSVTKAGRAVSKSGRMIGLSAVPQYDAKAPRGIGGVISMDAAIYPLLYPEPLPADIKAYQGVAPRVHADEAPDEAPEEAINEAPDTNTTQETEA